MDSYQHEDDALLHHLQADQFSQQANALAHQLEDLARDYAFRDQRAKYSTGADYPLVKDKYYSDE